MSIISLFDMRRIRLIIVLDIAGSGRSIGTEIEMPFFVCSETKTRKRQDQETLHLMIPWLNAVYASSLEFIQ